MASYREDALEEWDEESHDAAAGAGLASYRQGFDPLAKQSSRYLATGASILNCATDRSQYLTNLSAGASFLFESSPAARFDFSHPRTIGFVVLANNTDTGSLFRNGAASPTRMRFSAADTLELVNNNTSILTYTLGLGAASARLVLAWTSEANPDTTGASDAVLSTLHVWNTTAGTYDRARVTHAVASAKVQTAFFGAADAVPTAVFTGTIQAILFENRCVSATELAADWVTPLVAPSSDVVTDLQGLPPAQGAIDGESHWQGPMHVWACSATRRLERRTLQWLRNDRMRIVPAWTNALLTATDAFIRGAPASSADRMSIAWLVVAPVPDNCNRIWARVHLRSYVTSGPAVPVRVRLWSFSKPPGSLGLLGGGGGNEQLVPYATPIVTVTRDDTSGPGSYVVLGSCPIARGSSGIRAGKTYLVLSLAVDPDNISTNDAAARIEVGALHVNAYYKTGGQPLPVSP